MITYQKRCIKCGSLNISFWVGASAGMIYLCKDCGYRGPLVVEEDISDNN